jgi:hypothetical protein
MENPLTGQKDVDLIIFDKLDDRELFIICPETKNNYVKKLCETTINKRLLENYKRFDIQTLFQIKEYLNTNLLEFYKFLYKFTFINIEGKRIADRDAINGIIDNYRNNNNQMDEKISELNKLNLPNWLNKNNFLIKIKEEMLESRYVYDPNQFAENISQEIGEILNKVE